MLKLGSATLLSLIANVLTSSSKNKMVTLCHSKEWFSPTPNKTENALHHKGSALDIRSRLNMFLGPWISQKLSSYRKPASCPFQVEDYIFRDDTDILRESQICSDHIYVSNWRTIFQNFTLNSYQHCLKYLHSIDKLNICRILNYDEILLHFRRDWLYYDEQGFLPAELFVSLLD